jgi:hypothetical protein
MLVSSNTKVFLTLKLAMLVSSMNSKQRKTLEAIFASPTPRNLPFSEMESLFRAIGCKVTEKGGSHISFRMTITHKDGTQEVFREDFHKPHPGKEAKAYQVERARKFLTRMRQLP